MLCEVRSLGLSGISGYEVRAECDLSACLLYTSPSPRDTR